MSAQIIQFPAAQPVATPAPVIDNQSRIRAAYSYLTPLSEGGEAIKNMRIELKRHFAGCKFSVTMKHYGTINIGWTDGPTVAQVEAITNKYASGSFDGMTDSYNYSRDDFNRVFGDARYIFTNRHDSPDSFKAALAILVDRFAGNIGADFTATYEDFHSGKLYNVSMNMNGEAYRDNVQSYIHRIIARTPAPGFEYPAEITEDEGACCVRYFDHRDGEWQLETGETPAECLDQIEWRALHY